MKKSISLQPATPFSGLFRNCLPAEAASAQAEKLPARRLAGGEIRHSPNGFSLVEMLFYIALLSLALLAITQTLLVVVRSYGTLRSAQYIEQDGGFAMERMVREIRDASGITDAGSMFGSHPGELLLASTDVSGTARTVDFYLANGQLTLKENGVVTGALIGTKTYVTNLVFRKITTARSKGIKIEMTIQSGNGRTLRSEKLYGTAVLRNSY